MNVACSATFSDPRTQRVKSSRHGLAALLGRIAAFSALWTVLSFAGIRSNK